MDTQIAEKIEVKPKTPFNKHRRTAAFIDLWARLPVFLRLLAIGGLALTVTAVGIGYWSLRGKQDFRLKGGEPELTMEVEAVINGYERRVTNGDKLQMLVRADRETKYADGRHELDNIFLENYPENSATPDRITAIKAVYQPDANPENFTVNFSGNVNFETRDNLKVQTEQILYDKQREFAETSAALSFSRDNISGNAVGAKLNVKDKHLELLNQVEINVAPQGNLAKNSLTDFGASDVKIFAARASFDQELAQLELDEGVNIVITPQKSANAPTTIRSEKAVYQKTTQKLDLSGGVEIVTASDNVSGNVVTNQDASNRASPVADKKAVPVTIRADAASYEQGNGKVYLNGNASLEQVGELMSGERMTADLSNQKKLQAASTVGNAFLRTVSVERTTTVNAAEMDFKFDPNQQIQLANATNNVKVRSVSGETIIDLTEANALVLNFKMTAAKSLLEKMTTSGNTNISLTNPASADYSNVQMLAPNSTEVLFAAQNERSVLKQMTTGGRTTVLMSAPASQSQNPKAANKKLVADSLKLLWNGAGQDLDKAEAVGNAEMYVFPLAAAANVDKDSLFAGRFDCNFYEAGNLAKTFVATGSAKAILEPTVPAPERGTRNLLADKMTANFERASQAVESFAAVGNAKFNELDRNGTANNFVYTAADETVRLRGGEPTVWDNRARLKALEIDSNTRTNISSLRGKVATTYYSQEQTGGATPFTKVNSPVFIVSGQAEFNHATGLAVYTGNARAWQDNNFVRADKLVLQRDQKSMFGEGAVQSALYNAKRRENGKETTVPVFAQSDRMNYSDASKLLDYESNVEIRQGTERMTSGRTEVYLNQSNEVDKSVAQTNVVVTEPGRKATGDWAQYTAADEVIVLRGNPATVEDAAQGASAGRQLTLYLRENRVEGQGGASQSAPGRVRSTHKITKQ